MNKELEVCLYVDDGVEELAVEDVEDVIDLGLSIDRAVRVA